MAANRSAVSVYPTIQNIAEQVVVCARRLVLTLLAMTAGAWSRYHSTASAEDWLELDHPSEPPGWPTTQKLKISTGRATSRAVLRMGRVRNGLIHEG